jgi:hypothetical protein
LAAYKLTTEIVEKSGEKCPVAQYVEPHAN